MSVILFGLHVQAFRKIVLNLTFYNMTSCYNPRARLFKKLHLEDQNDRDLKIPCFGIQNQVIHLTFVTIYRSDIGLDHTLQDDHIWITSAVN